MKIVPPLSRRLMAAWVRNNPAYLLSALTMLAGCYLLLEPGGTRPRSAAEVWSFLGVATLYKLGLIGGIWLGFRCRGPRRETLMLTGVLALFFGDAWFLGHALQSVGPRTALAGSLALLALTALELLALSRALGGRLPLRPAVFVWVSLALFLLLPRVLIPLEHAGALGETQLTLAAWLLVLPWILPGLRGARSDVGLMLEAVTLLLGPVHLIAMLLVCTEPLTPGMAAPFCLGAAWLLLGLEAAWASRLSLCVLLLGLLLGGPLAWAAAAPLALRAVLQRRSALWLSTAALLASYRLACSGWLPRSSRAWGAVAVVGAFVLLGLGLVTTGLRERFLAEEEQWA